jgi:hypothetical protein
MGHRRLADYEAWTYWRGLLRSRQIGFANVHGVHFGVLKPYKVRLLRACMRFL